MSADPHDMDIQPISPNEKKGKGGLIAVIIILLLIAAIVVVLVMDIGGIREQHIMGFLRNAPLIGSLFPEPEEEDAIEVMTEEELRVEWHLQQDLIASLRNQNAELNAQLYMANARLDHSMWFQNNWQQYREAQAALLQMLAHNFPEDFTAFFAEYINPDFLPEDILAAAFGEAVQIEQFNEEEQDLVSTLNNMEEDSAADLLTEMLDRNAPLALRLVRAMGNSRRALIFDAMETSTATTFTIMLSTTPPTFTPLVPPPYIPEFVPPEIVVPVATPPPVEEDYEDEDDDGDEEDEDEE